MGLGIRRLAWKGLHRYFPDWAAKHAVRTYYNRRATQIPDRALPLLNYGYASLDPGDPDPVLAGPDHEARFHLHLYDHLARQVDLRGRAVLEVGSGRGAGTDYLGRAHGPASVTGLDLAEANVGQARRRYGRPGLTFQRGDAEALPFPDRAFGAVINVESSHLYPRPDRFFREAYRVLAPGGHFLLADLGDRARMDGLAAQLGRAGFLPVAARDITANVVAAIEADDRRRTAILESVAVDARDFRELADWARLVGTAGYQAFRDGRDRYGSYVLRKP
jgi:SAM-dependent methyltransferase